MYCADGRDALELRKSEAALRGRCSELEAALQGHELRAKLSRLEEAERGARGRADAAGVGC